MSAKTLLLSRNSGLKWLDRATLRTRRQVRTKKIFAQPGRWEGGVVSAGRLFVPWERGQLTVLKLR